MILEIWSIYQQYDGFMCIQETTGLSVILGEPLCISTNLNFRQTVGKNELWSPKVLQVPFSNLVDLFSFILEVEKIQSRWGKPKKLFWKFSCLCKIPHHEKLLCNPSGNDHFPVWSSGFVFDTSEKQSIVSYGPIIEATSSAWMTERFSLQHSFAPFIKKSCYWVMSC